MATNNKVVIEGAERNKTPTRVIVGDVMLHLGVLIALVWAIFPLMFVLSAALDPAGGLSSNILPTKFSTVNFKFLFTEPNWPFATWFKNSLIVCTINCSTSASSVTSQDTDIAFPPAALISSAVASPLATSRSAATTFKPSAAKAKAVARPIPAPAPVTTATCPENLMLIIFILEGGTLSVGTHLSRPYLSK